MKTTITLLALVASLTASAQTEVRNSSFSFAGGVYPTYSVVFNGTDKTAVEKWFKEQLKPISADIRDAAATAASAPLVLLYSEKITVRKTNSSHSAGVSANASSR